MLKMLLILIVAGLAIVAYRAVTGEETGHLLRRRFGARFCAMAGHRRSAGSVRKVEQHYVGRCRRCGTRLVKDSREGEWHVPARNPEDYGIGTEPLAPEADGGTHLAIGVGLAITAAAIAAGMAIAPHHLQPRDASTAPRTLAPWEARR